MPIIGLTGNFGMGKTTVLRLFNALGANTYNSDDFVHGILKRPETIKKITRLLGDDVVTKRSGKISLNKKRVAGIVFNEPLKRKSLERIIHPEVLKMIRTMGSMISKKDKSAIVVFEVPLLFEVGFDKYFDKTVVVFCNRKNAFGRAGGKGFSEEDAKKRILAQMPITRKIALADFRIENNGGLEDLEKRVGRVFNALIHS